MNNEVKKLKYSWMCLLLTSLLVACESADCTLQNKVALNAGFYAGSAAVQLSGDTLTITAIGTDSVLLNRGLNVHKFSVPMSYAQPVDTFVLHLYGEEYDLYDTIWAAKTNYPYFESPDCPAFFFHDISSVGCTNTFIDSVKLVIPKVNFGQYEQLKIFIRTAP